MNRKRKWIGALAMLSQACSPALAGRYAIRDVTMIDGTGRPAVRHRTILIDNDHIAAVGGPRLPIGKAKVIDGRGKYLIPGMIDAHIHLRDTGPDGKKHSMDVATAQAALAGFLALGFTTVADLGNLPGTVQIMRNADPRISARLLIAGRLFTSPGGRNADIGIALTSADPAVLARHRLEEHPDLIKMVEDNGGFGGQSTATALSTELLRAIVEESHRHGLRVVVHVARETDARNAIAAGADGLAHPVWAEAESEDFVQLMARRRIPFATTLAVADQYGRLMRHPEYLDRPDYLLVLSEAERNRIRAGQRAQFLRQPVAAWREQTLPTEMRNVVRIVRAGGIAALGTDLVSGASSHREMQLLRQAGLSPLEVIRIATLNAAVFLGRDRDLGSIAPGKIADLVLLNRDPMADIDATEDIAMVMHDGLVVDRAALPVAGSKELLRRDLRANQAVNS
ncbi:amidohydrolase family protein [Sphingomonas sp.]|uniref:amidohydrolase family protein n=1 Tax=Sphingomonas sp. TaxID=28214 RepID=UPI0025FE35EC|nr:amidohydrolase family protein [Sphingomonas sp.]